MDDNGLQDIGTRHVIESGLAIVLAVCGLCLAAGVVVYYIGVVAAALGSALGMLIVGVFGVFGLLGQGGGR